MDKQAYSEAFEALRPRLELVRQRAHQLHDAVGQKYDKVRPYGFHLDMVAQHTAGAAAEVCQSIDDILPIMFGAYFHDSIEDARLTYHNVIDEALNLGLTKDQALMGAEIAYALTNEKGRTRAERANDKYYAGIRATPYAPMVKLADRAANFGYSKAQTSPKGRAMLATYTAEMPHFLEKVVDPSPADPRLAAPAALLAALQP